MRSNSEKALIVICVYNEWLQLQLFYREESQDNLKCVSNNLWVWFVLRGNGWFYCASVEQRIQRIFWPYPLKYFVVHEWDDQLCTQGHVWSWYNIGARQLYGGFHQGHQAWRNDASSYEQKRTFQFLRNEWYRWWYFVGVDLCVDR